MSDWLSEIEYNLEMQNRFDVEYETKRMARVIRELSKVGLWAEKLKESFDEDEPDKVTLVGLRLGKLRSILSNLSLDAKEVIDELAEGD